LMPPGLAAIAGKLGITRLADITGLDIAGLPVVQAVRPFSLSNAVSQGKGATLDAAAASAIFESAESFFAERLDNFNTIQASAERLGIPPARFESHLLEGMSTEWRHRNLSWVEARNLLSGHIDLVPLELVHTAYSLPAKPEDGVFSASTTGLAAALDADDAARHGIMECVERDAIARAQNTHGFLQRRRIDPATILDSEVIELLEVLREKGFLVGLWHAPSQTGIAVIWCHVMEDCEAETALLPLPAEGSAARNDPAKAICHAVYEALQSRLTAISGARDDFTRRNYPNYPDWAALAAHRRLLADGPREIALQALQRTPLEMNDVLVLLERAGFADVCEIRLDTSPVDEVTAVKILVPSLLPLTER
jgi:YcaO-like protein with predicted kinase domain